MPHTHESYCFVCQTHPEDRYKTVSEGGITTRSLHNAHVLLKRWGDPIRVVIKGGPREKIDFKVVATWAVPKGSEVPREHTFTGFAWGYGGEGPHGLATFLKTVKAFSTRNSLADMEEISRWPDEIEIVFVKDVITKRLVRACVPAPQLF